MKILFDICHPAHVHLFKNAIWILQNKGHEIKITCRNKDVTLDLLNIYGFEYEEIGVYKKTRLGKVLELIKADYKLYKIANKFRPDILVGGDGNIYVTHISWLTGKKSIVFNDSENLVYEFPMMIPFASTICTPSYFKRDLGKKQIRYNGCHELAYLHPNYFTPNPAVLDEIGLDKQDTFVILRFVSWGASHDVGHNGLSLEIKRKAVNEFKKYGRVLITSERALPEEFEKYRITVSPEKIHDLLYYATFLYGESATMASECAVMGTHAIFCDFAGRGYTDEEEEKYGLVFNFKLDEKSQEKSIDKALELLKYNELRQEGEKKRNEMLNDKIDVTAFMVRFVENYFKSFCEQKENPNILKNS